MDLITDLPPADGFDSILVVVDQGLSKGVILIPCNKTLTSEDTAQLLLENLYKRFRLPDKIISDRGPQFCIFSTSKAPWHQISAVNRIPPSNRWNYRTCQSRNQSIPVDLLRFTPGRLASSHTYNGIHSQQQTTCRQNPHSIRIDVWRIPGGNTLVIRKHEIPIDRRKDDDTYETGKKPWQHTN